jgi:mannose-6-phosphate isomerase
VHALGKGLVIFEIQQNSDTTYRVFDWNRVDAAGKPRQLHIEESLKCIDFEDFEPSLTAKNGAPIRPLARHALFGVDLVEIAAGGEHRELITELRVVGVVSGAVQIADVQLRAGRFALIPAALNELHIVATADAKVLVAAPG